jgi:hypothetical protein
MRPQEYITSTTILKFEIAEKCPYTSCAKFIDSYLTACAGSPHNVYKSFFVLKGKLIPISKDSFYVRLW